MTNASLAAELRAVLLYRGGAVREHELLDTLSCTPEALREAINEVRAGGNESGITIVEENGRIALSTTAQTAPVIERMRRDELAGALGKAGLETLAVIVYQGPISRADIEYIRGVNVSSMLRTLMIRGLIERVDNPNDKRSFLYRATVELPAYLSVTRLEDLPEYATIRSELETLTAEVPTPTPET